jgi:anti-sigma B factor antagonist
MAVDATRFSTSVDDLPAGGVVIRVTGELELGTIDGFELQLGNVLGRGERFVAVDLDGCSFVDSSGLATVLHGSRRLRGSGGELVVVCQDSEVLKLFRLTAIDQSVPVFETLDDALRAREPTA